MAADMCTDSLSPPFMDDLLPLPGLSCSPLAHSLSAQHPTCLSAPASSQGQQQLGGLVQLLPPPHPAKGLRATGSTSCSLSSSFLDVGTVYDSKEPAHFLLVEDEEEGGTPPPPCSLMVATPPHHPTPLEHTLSPAAAAACEQLQEEQPAAGPQLPAAAAAAAVCTGLAVPDLQLGTASGNEGTPDTAPLPTSPGLLPMGSCDAPEGPGGDPLWWEAPGWGAPPSPPSGVTSGSSPRLVSPSTAAAAGLVPPALSAAVGVPPSPAASGSSPGTTLYRLVRLDDLTGTPLRGATREESQQLAAQLAAEGVGGSSSGSGTRAAAAAAAAAAVSSEWGDDLDVPCSRPPRPFHHKGGGPCDHCGVMESPQWRRGPPAKPILCNACGTRYRRTAALGSNQRGGGGSSSGGGSNSSGGGKPPLSKQGGSGSGSSKRSSGTPPQVPPGKTSRHSY